MKIYLRMLIPSNLFERSASIADTVFPAMQWRLSLIHKQNMADQMVPSPQRIVFVAQFIHRGKSLLRKVHLVRMRVLDTI